MNFALSKRDSQILEMIVTDYIAHAMPVGSVTISKGFDSRFSPSTIRNIMADLTELGFLVQPHASAGRVPTHRGLRYFVDGLLKFGDLTEDEERAIKGQFSQIDGSLKVVLDEASRVLASFTHNVSLIAAPTLNDAVLKQIEFIRLSERRLLGIFIGQDGIVENRVVETNEDFSLRDLEKINNYCNNAFMGLTLDEARAKISSELKLHRSEYDRLLTRAFLFANNFFNKLPKSEVVINGKSNLLNGLMAKEMKKIKQLMGLLEEKEELLKLLDRSRDGGGVKIFIGAEVGYGGMEDISAVIGPYKKDGKIVGTLGVLGPACMNYSKMVSIVDFTSKLISDILSVKE